MPRPISTAQFQHRLAKKHPQIEVLGEYVAAKVPIPCRCRTCGHTWDSSTPYNLLNQLKYGCPNCATQAAKLRWQTEIQEWLCKHRPDIQLDGDLGTARSKTWFKCVVPSCSFRWRSTFRSVRGSKSGCPQCALRRISESRKVPESEFRNWLRENRPMIDLVDYVNQSSQATFRCLNPDHDPSKPYLWKTTPEIIRLQGRGLQGCKHCGWRVSGQRLLVDEAEKRSWMASHKPTILMGDDYKSTKLPCTFTCTLCTYSWKTSIAVFTNNDAGCPNCAGVARVTEAEFLRRLSQQTSGGISLIGAYRGYTRRAQFRCNRDGCRHVWSIQPCRLTSAKPTGCPACAEFGFDVNKTAWLYLMSKPGEQQFGITNDLAGRIQLHERDGFQLLDVIGPALGLSVLGKERELKLWLKSSIGLHIQGKKENWPTTQASFGSLAELFAAAEISPLTPDVDQIEVSTSFEEPLQDIPATWNALPKTKLEALMAGSARFFDGSRCRHGHLSPRFTSGPCVECLRLSQLRIGERKKAERRESIQNASQSRICPECMNSFLLTHEMRIDKIYCSNKCASAQSKRNYVSSDPERRREQSRKSARKRYQERKIRN